MADDAFPELRPEVKEMVGEAESGTDLGSAPDVVREASRIIRATDDKRRAQDLMPLPLMGFR